jgi:hypothetical protein
MENGDSSYIFQPDIDFKCIHYNELVWKFYKFSILRFLYTLRSQLH